MIKLIVSIKFYQNKLKFKEIPLPVIGLEPHDSYSSL